MFFLVSLFLILSLAMHESLIENWRLKPNESIEEFPYKISDTVYKENLHKVNKVSFKERSIETRLKTIASLNL